MEDTGIIGLLQQMQQQLASLQAEVQDLRAAVDKQPSLGLSNGRIYLQIEKDKNTVWHTYEGEEAVPVKQETLRGYITGIYQSKKGEHPKLHTFVQGDQEYVIVTGFDTQFAKGMLASLAVMTPEQLKGMVIIKPDTGDEEKNKGKNVVFCNIVSGGRSVIPGTTRNRDNSELFAIAQKKLRGDTSPVASSRPHPVASAPVPTTFTPPTPVPPPPARPESAPQIVDWAKVCADLGISGTKLKMLADELGLPQSSSQLDRAQSTKLRQAAYAKYDRSAS